MSLLFGDAIFPQHNIVENDVSEDAIMMLHQSRTDYYVTQCQHIVQSSTWLLIFNRYTSFTLALENVNANSGLSALLVFESGDRKRRTARRITTFAVRARRIYTMYKTKQTIFKCAIFIFKMKFDNCGLISITLFLWHSVMNCERGWIKCCNLALNMPPYYLVKFKCLLLQRFIVMSWPIHTYDTLASWIHHKTLISFLVR